MDSYVSEVTLFEYNVSTILSPIVAREQQIWKSRKKAVEHQLFAGIREFMHLKQISSLGSVNFRTL